jgi:lysophospholipase
MAENSRRPIFMLGESMGGILAVDFIARRPALLSGLILVAPSFRDRLGVSLRLKAEAFLNVLIRRRKWYDVPWNPDDFTRDQAVIDTLNRDPLEVRKVTAQFYFAYTPVSARARRGASLLNLPVLVMLPGDDRMIDSEYTKAYFERIASPDKELKEYPGYYHALLLDLERERIHEDVAEWVVRRS